MLYGCGDGDKVVKRSGLCFVDGDENAFPLADFPLSKRLAIALRSVSGVVVEERSIWPRLALAIPGMLTEGLTLA